MEMYTMDSADTRLWNLEILIMCKAIFYKALLEIFLVLKRYEEAILPVHVSFGKTSLFYSSFMIT